MRMITALNCKSKAIRRLRDVYERLGMFGMTSEELTYEYLEIVKSLRKCPQWVRSFVDGYNTAIRAQFEKSLVFFYTLQDGSLVSTHRDRSDYYEKLGISVSMLSEQVVRRGHYWIRIRSDEGRKVEVMVPYYVTDMNKQQTETEEKGEQS